MSEVGITWTDDRVEALKKLWSEGLSASQIAAELGGVTRNAVIGKVHRLGLSGRGKPTAAPTPRARIRTKREDQPASPRKEVPASDTLVEISHNPRADFVSLNPHIAPPEVVVPLSERVTIMELRDSMCRWPLGDPTSADFRYCGARCSSGIPYCTHHAQIAYQPASDRRRDRRSSQG
jgi:GcrA cell cycle regulator